MLDPETEGNGIQMQQIRILGSVIIAIIALSAIVATAASAELPEFEPGAEGTTITGKGGKGKLEVKGEPPVSCEKTEATGKVVGKTKKEASATVTFSECTAFTIFGAHTLKDASNIIKIDALLKLCYIKKAAPIEVGALTKLLSPVHIEVAGKLLVITGDQVAKITPINTDTTKFLLEYRQAGGVAKPEKCEGQAKETYLTEINENGKLLESALETNIELIFGALQVLLA